MVRRCGDLESIMDSLRLGGLAVTPAVRAAVGKSISEQGHSVGYWLGLKRSQVPILVCPNGSRLPHRCLRTVLAGMLLFVCGARMFSWVVGKFGFVAICGSAATPNDPKLSDGGGTA